MQIWNAEIDAPCNKMKMKKSALEVLWVRKLKLIAIVNAAICIICRAPYLCTRCPTINSDVRFPIDPRLRSEPNSPFERRKFAFTSGKRGTQDMICKPKRKKSTLRRSNSLLVSSVFIKKEHLLALCEPQSNEGHLNPLKQKDLVNDSLPYFYHHLKLS